MITRGEALKFLEEKIENKNIIKHMLATEAIMRALALKLKTREEINEDEWAMAGLLHDGDYCNEVPPEKQGLQVTEWLKEKGFDISENIVHAMAAHNSDTGIKPISLMDWSLFCADPLTGLIVATALVMPDKKLASVKSSSVLKKFGDPSFARGTRREDIVLCQEKLGIPLEEFIKISLEAMQKISPELGL